jgi:CheY-like chemotaxis protein
MSDDRPTPQPLRSGKSLRILVVEDHADTLRVLARLLDHFGHKISVADSTHSALQFLQSKTFDVILSDISLPDGTGYEVVSQAKEKQAVKAVALTGFDPRKIFVAVKKPVSISISANRLISTSCAPC